jgi:hypothetical protein
LLVRSSRFSCRLHSASGSSCRNKQWCDKARFNHGTLQGANRVTAMSCHTEAECRSPQQMMSWQHGSSTPCA